GLRAIFRHLASSGILSSAGTSIPYRANLAGEEKDFEIAARAVSLLRERIGRLEDVGAGGEGASLAGSRVPGSKKRSLSGSEAEDVSEKSTSGFRGVFVVILRGTTLRGE
ncbi:hypothetical protein BDK51DRAFT_22926, partial [Blyttiomyces helicus]